MTAVSMTKGQAEAAIKEWAESYYRVNIDDPMPEVEVFCH